MSPQIGSWRCGSAPRRRRRPSRPARPPSRAFSRRIASAASMRPKPCAFCARSRLPAPALEAATAHIGAVAERIRFVNQQLKTAHRKLDELCARLEQPTESEPGQKSEPRDVAILRSLPGVGRINLATLLAEAWQPLQRREYSVLRAMSGAAPVTCRSGKACIVLRRLACNKRLEKAVYHWARRRAARPAQPSQIRRTQTPRPQPRPGPAKRRRSLALPRLHLAATANPVRSRLQAHRYRRRGLTIPWFDHRDHPFVPTCRRQSAARSGSHPEGGGAKRSTAPWRG